MQSQRFYRNCEPWLLDLDQYKQSQIFALVGLLLWKGVSWWSSALCSRGVLRHGWSELKWPAVWPKLWPIRVRCCIQVVELSFTSVYFLASQRGLLKYWSTEVLKTAFCFSAVWLRSWMCFWFALFCSYNCNCQVFFSFFLFFFFHGPKKSNRIIVLIWWAGQPRLGEQAVLKCLMPACSGGGAHDTLKKEEADFCMKWSFQNWQGMLPTRGKLCM